MLNTKTPRWTLVVAVVTSLMLLASGSLVGHGLAPVATGLGVWVAALGAWLTALIYGTGEGPRHSGLSMFKSQWQVPLYAALAVYLATVAGSFLKSLGADTVCGQWPLCPELLTTDFTSLVVAHAAHRVSAALAGLFLIYTTVYVWRRHQHRPLLLVLTGTAVVLFTTQVMVGAQAARFGLSPIGSMGHLAIATALVATLMAIAAVGYYSPSVPSIAGASQAAALPLPAQRPFRETFNTYLALTKPRILVLLLITGYAAMVVAQKGLPSLGLTLLSMLGLGMSCGAANAINMWYDQDIDQIMNRTKKRPIPAGLLTPEQVLAFGILTGALSFVLLALAVNLMTALLSLSGLLFYVCIYTMWLKRTSVQNIVIGGVAGSIPPLVGWAAVTGQVTWASFVMFMIVFMWTPPHFWALALFRNEDYTRAKIPMMPVVKGEKYTKWHIVGYALLLFPTVAALYWTGVVGEVYLWGSLIATAIYFASTVILFVERLPEQKWAKKSFYWSIFWLGAIFVLMCADIRA